MDLICGIWWVFLAGTVGLWIINRSVIPRLLRRHSRSRVGSSSDAPQWWLQALLNDRYDRFGRRLLKCYLGLLVLNVMLMLGLLALSAAGEHCYLGLLEPVFRWIGEATVMFRLK